MRPAAPLESLGYMAVAAVSVLAGLAAVFALNHVVPTLRAPVVLFPLYSEVVAVDVYGAVFPLLLSTALLVVLRREGDLRGLKPFRGPRFWAPVGAVCLAFVLVTGYIHLSRGTFALTTFESEALVPLAGAFGAVYALWRRRPASVVGAEAYAIGAFGTFLSDLVLTFSGAMQAPRGALVWGGGGTYDLCLWFGVYLAIPASIVARAAPGLVSYFRRGWREPAPAPPTSVDAVMPTVPNRKRDKPLGASSSDPGPWLGARPPLGQAEPAGLGINQG